MKVNKWIIYFYMKLLIFEEPKHSNPTNWQDTCNTKHHKQQIQIMQHILNIYKKKKLHLYIIK